MKRELYKNVNDAYQDLEKCRNNTISKPAWLEKDISLPFSSLSDDEFEIFCYLLLCSEYPEEKIYYYGKVNDLGRDIVFNRSNGTEIIQCKRYSNNIGPSVINKEIIKLHTNIVQKDIDIVPKKISFYVTPFLTSKALDIFLNPQKWKNNLLNKISKSQS